MRPQASCSRTSEARPRARDRSCWLTRRVAASPTGIDALMRSVRRPRSASARLNEVKDGGPDRRPLEPRRGVDAATRDPEAGVVTPNLRVRCETNVWRVLSANSPTEPPHRAQSAQRGPRGARRKALVTAHASAPGGAAPFAATRTHADFATRIHSSRSLKGSRA
jgi:hypothetical protein